MYGLVQKNEAMLEADRKFIESVKALGHTRESGAVKSVEFGWQYFSKGDLRAAMLRFNQAWLLDPNNPNAYHGFAVMVAARDGPPAFPAAKELFHKSISLLGVARDGYADFGRLLLMDGKPQEAIPVLEAGLAKHADYVELNGLYGAALFEAGRREEACAPARAGLGRDADGLKQALQEILNAPDCRGG